MNPVTQRLADAAAIADETGLRTVSERIRWARTISGLSQRKLSALAGLSNRHVCSLEDGRLLGHLRADTAKALARVLGVRAAWLVYGASGGHRPKPMSIVAAVECALLAAEPRRRTAS
jgi:transcriptional regulator with XRE-family HTH domain